MAKDKKKNKAATKLKKQEKQERKQQKRETKDKKKRRQADLSDSDEEDIEALLDAFKKQQEEQYKVTEEVSAGAPTRRANATLTPNPLNPNELIFFGGEYYDGNKCEFYNDLFRYNIEKGEWKRITSPNSPGPRSSHQVVITPQGTLFLFGGEFASRNETQFFHYKALPPLLCDFWTFDLKTNKWDRMELKVKPSPRSGHRMCLWKHYIVLFGGFYDTYVQTKYFDDLWLFDLQEYKWIQVDIPGTTPKPSPRSGFQLFTYRDTVFLYGGYYKQFIKGERAKGVVHTDLWTLKMSTDVKQIRWEKRKKQGFYPGPRSGATMALYKNKAIMMGGVYDEETEDDGMVSTCYNDMYALQVDSLRWYSVTVRAKSQKKRRKERKKDAPGADDNGSDDEAVAGAADDGRDNDDDNDVDDEEGHDRDQQEDDESQAEEWQQRATTPPVATRETDSASETPSPRARFNSMLAISRNQLFVYGGILDYEGKEYTLDDFWSLNLDKVDAWKCVDPGEGLGTWLGEESDDDEDDDDEDDDEDDDDDDDDSEDDEGEGGDEGEDGIEANAGEVTTSTKAAEQEQAGEQDGSEQAAFDFGQVKKKKKKKEKAGKKAAPSNDDEYEEDEEHKAKREKEAGLKKARFSLPSIPNMLEENQHAPKPNESLKDYYKRTSTFWVGRAFEDGENENTGKSLRKDAFAVCREKYDEWQPMLEELKKLEIDLEGEDNNGQQRGKGGTGQKVDIGRNRR
ncbi:Kelch repeat-containing protein 3 [Sorochytrium milnesiophthora]